MPSLPSLQPKLQIVGPKGLRQLLRSILTLCGTELGATYVVHELLLPGELPTPSSPEDCHLNEVPGRDVFLDAGGEPFWRDVLNEAGNQNGWVVDAGVIPHRGEPCKRFRTSPSVNCDMLTCNCPVLVSNVHWLHHTFPVHTQQDPASLPLNPQSARIPALDPWPLAQAPL